MSARNLVADELTKLTALWWNTMAAGAIVVGFLTPLSQLSDPEIYNRVGVGLIYSNVLYVTAGILAHIVGRALIKRRFKS